MSIFKNQHQLPWRTLLQQIEFSILHLQKVQKLKKMPSDGLGFWKGQQVGTSYHRPDPWFHMKW